MAQLYTTQQSETERSILARLILPDADAGTDPLDELHGLATTAGTTVVAELTQKRSTPDHSTYLGKGKVEELKQLVEARDADVIIFDNDLNPAQTRNLEKATDRKVIDRTELILDIFAAGARTHESRLAVELAQLEYSLPRLKRMWTHLSRQSMGVGMRGPGEKQLEVDRRLAQKRIHDLRTELDRIETRREVQVASRTDVPTVSLVGYTNAGKSTLMNALTDAGVYAKDELFATLDTRTRRWNLPGWGTVLLSDTVGFIRDLPHQLVASFKATLEETRQADLLLHVADASSDAVFEQITAVFHVLENLGIEEKRHAVGAQQSRPSRFATASQSGVGPVPRTRSLSRPSAARGSRCWPKRSGIRFRRASSTSKSSCFTPTASCCPTSTSTARSSARILATRRSRSASGCQPVRWGRFIGPRPRCCRSS